MPNYPLKRRPRPTLILLSGLSAGLAGWSCSQASDGEPGRHVTPAPVPSHGGSLGSGGARFPDLDVAAGGTSAVGQGGSAVCNAQVREGQRVPIDMYFLVDSSGSMGEAVSGGTKWDVVSSALVSFVKDPRNASTGVGIGYFPGGARTSCAPGVAGCFCIPIINICVSAEGGSCTVADYSTPAVPLSLPPQFAAVVSDIAGHRINGGTPTRPALDGALQYLGQWATQHPERKPLLVLATDGEPSGCESNTPEDVADVAASALAGPHAIRTFVIGVGRSLVSLNLVAKAGGTDHAFLVDTGGDVAKEFADALDQIRGAASSCDFNIPSTGDAGGAIDPRKVNVSYTQSGSSSPTSVSQTFNSDPSNCGSAGGWYYDNPNQPTKILICPATCSSFDTATNTSISIALGCTTVVR